MNIMNRNLIRPFLSIVLVAAALSLSPLAAAEDVKMVGVITKLTVAGDGKSAQATLKDNKSGGSVTINITDDETLDKFKDKRIQEGDEIRAKYDSSSGNKSKSFKRTSGC